MKKALSMLFLSTALVAAPLSTQAAGQPIEVKLQNYIGSKTALPFTTNGDYQIKGTSIFIQPGASYTMKVESGDLSLYKGSSLVKKFSGNVTIIPTITESMDRAMTINGNSEKKYLGEVEFTVESGKYVRPVNHINLEDYLKGVVPAEMPSSWGANGGLDALKAQAVAARTFVLKKGNWSIYDGQSDQVYKGYDWDSHTTKAVNETQGEVLKNGDKYAEAFYSSSNGGRVFSNQNVWGSALVPYLQTKKDIYDAKISPHGDWNVTLSKSQFDNSELDLKKPESWWTDVKEKDQTIISNMKKWLKSKKKIDEKHDIKIVEIKDMSFDIPDDSFTSTDVLKGKVSFTYYEKTEDDFVKNEDETIKLQTKTVDDTSYNIRFMLGTSIMKSPYVKSLNKKDDSYIINGGGFGHGIGMSQYGAYQMSKEGNNFRTILGYYYPTTKVNRELDLGDYSHELEGIDRYETSVSVSGYGWENRSKAVVIGRGDLSIDALTGSVLAKKLDSPLLLTTSKSLPETVLNEIKRLQPEKVYLLGGSNAIGTNVETQLKGLSFINDGDITRISGKERYETAVKVADEINNKDEIFVVTKDEKSPDALSIASYASMMQIPILYTTKDTLHESVEAYMKENAIKNVTIIGGQSAVSSGVERELANLAPNVTRVYGLDRYQTSLTIAEKYSDQFEEKTLFFARGDVFIDALPASALAAAMKSPLVLTRKDALPDHVGDWLDKRTVLADTYFLGGNGAINETVRRDIQEAFAD
ncbi:SpoIID/LytB domain-containing protein [Bacillus sp. es.034]|uniref:SpoIID/LytB domain-containing protein n=1 Tax=Bacillaceae TaxID=186817 RepID=UPI000BF39374|nr:SpoIID/LytB domain-containing protein [Bacillus sp. es.034]PFG04430.1 SpoIID/LytB domain protein [Bacillus sp. es.034]